MPTDDALINEGEKFLKRYGEKPDYTTGSAISPADHPSASAFAQSSLNPENVHDASATDRFKAGLRQGLLGYVEAPAYYAEKGIRHFDPEFRMPLHDWAKHFRDEVESSPAGLAGEGVGTLLPGFIPGLGELGLAGRAAMGGADVARMARAATAAPKVAEAARAFKPGEIFAKGFSNVERSKGDLGKLADIVRENRPVEAASQAREAAGAPPGVLRFEGPPPASGLSRLAERARMAGEGYRNINPVVRGMATGAAGGVLSRPATSEDEFKDQLLTGALLGGAAGRLGFPRTGPIFRGEPGRVFTRGQTPEFSKAEQKDMEAYLKSVASGHNLPMRLRHHAMRGAMFLLAHKLGLGGLSHMLGHFGASSLPEIVKRLEKGNVRAAGRMAARASQRHGLAGRAGAITGAYAPDLPEEVLGAPAQFGGGEEDDSQ